MSLQVQKFAVIGYCMMVGVLLTAGLCKADPVYQTFDVPGGAFQVIPNSINDSGVLTGTYLVRKRGPFSSFIRNPDGSIITFSVPNSYSTEANCINKHGEVVGYYTPKIGKPPAAFLRDADGTIETLDPEMEFAFSINDKREIVGSYYGTDGSSRGFLRKKNGKYVLFTPQQDATAIEPLDINIHGQITGYFNVSTKVFGFFRDVDGSIAVFDIPNALYTYPLAVNNSGEVIGVYTVGGYYEHGFFRSPDGTITLFDVPGATNTGISDLNDKGIATGFYIDRKGLYHGFIRAKDGSITSFDVPQNNFVTQGISINNKGEIAGLFRPGSTRRSPIGGFVRIP